MFKFNKGVKNYINAVDKIKIPILHEENNIEFVPRNKFSFTKPAFLSIAVVITFLLTSINLPLNNKDIPFSIKAYTGSESLDLKEGENLELPSGHVEDDTFVMQGLLISGHISKINATYDNGDVGYFGGDNNSELKTTEYIGNHSGVASQSKDSPYMYSIKFMDDEEIEKKFLDGKKIVDIPDDNTEGSFSNEDVQDENTKDSYIPTINSSCSYSTCSNTNSSEFIVDDEFKYNYILWSPGKEFLKQLCTTGIESISELPMANIHLTITFTDGHTEEKDIHLAFNRSGNLEINLS